MFQLKYSSLCDWIASVNRQRPGFAGFSWSILLYVIESLAILFASRRRSCFSWSILLYVIESNGDQRSGPTAKSFSWSILLYVIESAKRKLRRDATECFSWSILLYVIESQWKEDRSPLTSSFSWSILLYVIESPSEWAPAMCNGFSWSILLYVIESYQKGTEVVSGVDVSVEVFFSMWLNPNVRIPADSAAQFQLKYSSLCDWIPAAPPSPVTPLCFSWSILLYVIESKNHFCAGFQRLGFSWSILLYVIESGGRDGLGPPKRFQLKYSSLCDWIGDEDLGAVRLDEFQLKYSSLCDWIHVLRAQCQCKGVSVEVFFSMWLNQCAKRLFLKNFSTVRRGKFSKETGLH